MSKNCYLCGGAKYSVEHVPAKCFFPQNPNYRKNLITVPSCKVHNEATSKDDEYVRNIICMSIGNNEIAFNQFFNKVKGSFENSLKLREQTFQTTKQVFVRESQNGSVQQTYMFKIDRERFDKVIKKIGYALYYHKYGKVWQRGLIIATDSLLNVDSQQDGQMRELISIIRENLVIPKFDGNNPEVFQYKFEEISFEEISFEVLWMRFYGSFEVFVVPNTKTDHPDNI